MLKDNLKTLRKNKGLSQEELAIKLNVVRQTVSKWEQGLSVPDAEMLISISEIFDTPVSTILGENIDEKEKNDLKVISEKDNDQEVNELIGEIEEHVFRYIKYGTRSNVFNLVEACYDDVKSMIVP